MAKKDYVLEKALKGDLESLENVLGRVFSPIFDFAFHFHVDETAAGELTQSVLHEVSVTVLGGDLGVLSLLEVAAMSAVRLLQNGNTQTKNPDNDLAELRDPEIYVILVHLSLDVDLDRLDVLLGLDDGMSFNLLEQFIKDSNRSREEWCDRLDEHAAQIPLPSGIIESVVDSFDTDPE